MPISDKTRKILWGRSGNRCAICKKELVVDSTPHSDESVVGDECHIISPQPNGPRHDPSYPPEKLDSYENLLLLCRVHHKVIDDQVDTYLVDILRQFKANHEAWVSQKLNPTREEKPIRVRQVPGGAPSHLVRVSTGKELFDVIMGAYGWITDYDEPKKSEDTKLVADFLQTVSDYGDLQLEPAERIEAAVEMTKTIAELDSAGYYVFVGRENRIIGGGKGAPQNWPIAIVHVLHKDNKKIVILPVHDKKCS